MNKLTEEELLTIINRYDYELLGLEDSVGALCARKINTTLSSCTTPFFGSGDKIDGRYIQLSRIVAWIIEDGCRAKR